MSRCAEGYPYKMWPKLALGKKITDFVFQDATSDYLLVELERYNLPLFIDNGDTTCQINQRDSTIVAQIHLLKGGHVNTKRLGIFDKCYF